MIRDIKAIEAMNREMNNDCQRCKGTRSVKGGFKFVCSTCKRTHYIKKEY